jgi:hypothetical protein
MLQPLQQPPRRLNSLVLLLFVLTLLTLVSGVSVFAQDFSSSNYTVSNPTLFPGGYSSSNTFGLTSVISQIAIGSSTAATFKQFAGFLYFPFITTPVVSATAGNAQVALSWTAAEAAKFQRSFCR